MKIGKIAAFVAIGLFIQSPIAQAGIKAGGSCNSVGIIKKVSGKNFKCTLVKGKKIYVLQSEKKKVAPTPTPTPTPQPTKESPSALPIKFYGLSSQISLNAFNFISDYLQKQPTLETGEVILELSPNASSSLAKTTLEDMQKGFRFWQAFTPSSTKIHMVFADRSDLEWFKTTMERIQPNTSEWLPRIYSMAMNAPNGQYAGANGRDLSGNALFFYLPGKQTVATSAGWLGVGPHEWTHFAQNIISGDIGKAPCWFKEGQATYFGNAISNNDINGWSSVWKGQINSLKSDYPKFYELDEATLRKWFNDHELNMPNNICGPDGAFMIGGLATEYLVGNFGVDAINNFMLRLKNNEDWKSAITLETGKGYEDLMSEIVNYVLLQRIWSLK